jgi:hypothetical protein
MSAPANYDITLVRGDTFKKQFQLLTQINDDPEVPTDITGAIIKATTKQQQHSFSGIDFLVTLTVPDLGFFELDLTAEQTTAMCGTKWIWDSEITLNGQTTTLLSGVINILPGVTV